MRKCPHCKKAFTEDYVFCLDDGTRLEAADTDERDTVAMADISDRRAASSGSQYRWAYLTVGLLALAALVVAGTLFVYDGETRGSAGVPVSEDFDPSGTWKGEWTSMKGGLFGAELTLTDDGANQVSGHIEWTLRRSSIEEKNRKAGTKAIEYVQGSYEPLSRTISLTGYKKKDPGDLIVLDNYRLAMSADKRELGGSTRNQGRWSGRLVLRRAN